MSTTTAGRMYAYYVAYTAVLHVTYGHDQTVVGSQPIYMPTPIQSADQIADLQAEIDRTLRRQGDDPASIVITFWAPLPGDDIPAQ